MPPAAVVSLPLMGVKVAEEAPTPVGPSGSWLATDDELPPKGRGSALHIAPSALGPMSGESSRLAAAGGGCSWAGGARSRAGELPRALATAVVARALLLECRLAEVLLLADAVAPVCVVEADKDEALPREDLVTRVLDVAVVHDAAAGLGPDEQAVDVGRVGGEVGAAAGEAFLGREAQVEGERRLVFVQLEAAPSGSLRARAVAHDEEVAGARVRLLVEGSVEVRVVPPREGQQLLADRAVHQVLRLLAQLLHQHVLGGQGHAAAAPADRLADALHVVKDGGGLLGREQSERVHARGTCARPRLLAGVRGVELNRRRRAGCEDRGARSCRLRGNAAAAVDAEQLDERVDAERTARGDAQLVRLRRLLLAHLAGPARGHLARGLAGRSVLSCTPAPEGPESHRARLVAV
eukprot:scaffold77814_cov67-Phaeocystis_antarctica.AAC.15